ncbi:regulatory protein, luxR family [Leucobacter chromiiresistens]|uniref:Regulatory protein, luxR family n=2 Tax=Leucobacter chromiiresistens TaxID=1079994 RepID=A0A1H1BL59_9MICO|nr:regulatory protein, luxR family [Leucobacter chromiiresistens]
MQRMDDEHAQRILSDAVVEFARATRFDIAFGGLERAGDAVLSAVSGAEHGRLEGLRVRADRGLGGRALRERRPRIAVDYVGSRQITHEYDAHVRGEGIVGLFAMPVLVDGAPRAVLYGGWRGAAGPSGSFVREAAGVARDLSRELRIEDEVVRRLERRHGGSGRTGVGSSALPGSPVSPGSLVSQGSPVAPGPPVSPGSPVSLPPPTVEALRTVHAELRGALAESSLPHLRHRLRAIEHRLTALAAPPAGPGARRAPDAPHDAAATVRLSPREIDTLAQVALGATNAEVGRTLGLAENTVKSYLGAAMTKLDASTRHAAVSRARALGLLL